MTILLIAFDVDGTTDYEAAQQNLLLALPQPGTKCTDTGVTIDSWWVADDFRIDGNDCDSAVFVHEGAQKPAYDLLHEYGLTAAHNDPAPLP